ncbi:MAG: hypothetical protein ABIH00_02475 [Armatimonadota bacterium]
MIKTLSNSNFIFTDTKEKKLSYKEIQKIVDHLINFDDPLIIGRAVLKIDKMNISNARKFIPALTTVITDNHRYCTICIDSTKAVIALLGKICTNKDIKAVKALEDTAKDEKQFRPVKEEAQRSLEKIKNKK